MNKIESNLVNIPLGRQAHHLASYFAAEAMELGAKSTKKDRGKQVYLNTLAVYAVDSYLQWQGYETNNSKSDFGNVIVRSRLDVADIFITGIGKLECRFLWSEETNFLVPTEATEDRIGYVAVQLNDELDEATLLGFYPSFNDSLTSIAIDDLHSLDDLIDHLYRLELANNLFSNENDLVITKVKEKLEDVDIYDLVFQLERIYRLEADTEKPYAVKDMLAGNIFSIGRERETSVEDDDFELMELAEEVVEKLNQIWSES
ncbi:MAG: DUF1822 family protein [Xenococcaceae cyanobacterium MO_188.B29]|nr:DUF1822 family protein [Xenococcaceae cyanobacterium MO_188.B29]